MRLDARALEPGRLFRQLKDMIATCGSNEFIEVTVADFSTAQKVRAFASMSGCPVTVEKKEDCIVLRIDENTCGCGR
ncbi:MAG: hypothetical protein M0024_07610 [Nitrospiraceae bacterium]|nr:hypothetical protein [Nitrospiraceae bacterium]